MTQINLRSRRAYAFWALCAITTTSLPAQTFTSLWSFNGKDGANPFGTLVQAANGRLYGTTIRLGFYGDGTAFKITTDGSLNNLHNFCTQEGCPDGAEPEGLVLAANGDLYGVTYFGGASHVGNFYQLTPTGGVTPLYSFCSQSACPQHPEAGLIQGTYGDFYGVTQSGGDFNGGFVYKITPSGSLTTLYSFCSQKGCADGEVPVASLIQAVDGNFYGTTSSGGAYGHGTVFSISSGGLLTTIYSFCSQTACTDGSDPVAALVQSTDGSFYGTTYYGGTTNLGTVFRITPSGTFTTLHSFCSENSCTDGEGSWAQLIQATDGNFYGATYTGGDNGGGTIFDMSPDGALTTLYSFCAQASCADGQTVYAGLVQDTDGSFYGTTYSGGNYGFGTVFRLSVGLAPFVTTLPGLGNPGSTIRILGTNLTGATGVTFNGASASFTVLGPTEITATVPAGATTGTVQVVTPTGTLSSNVAFRVR